MNEPPIVMYGTKWCPDCHRAKKVFEQHETAYTWIDIEEDKEAVALVLKINHGHRVVPTIVFPDGSVLIEPSNQTLAAKLSGK
jgi:mycoredoxin